MLPILFATLTCASLVLCSSNETSVEERADEVESRHILNKWMPSDLWKVIRRNEIRMATEKHNQDYYDSAEHCYQRINGNNSITYENTSTDVKMVSSVVALMHCVVSTNAFYVPYNIYQDTKEAINQVRKTSSWPTMLERIATLPFIVLQSFFLQPIRTARQLGAIAFSTYAYWLFAEHK